MGEAARGAESKGATSVTEREVKEPQSAPQGPPPLHGDPLVALEVEGHGTAIAWLPLGARGTRPLIVATHGNYDTPESTCGIWGDIVGSRGFVLCPRGAPRADSPSPTDTVYHYLSTAALEKETWAAIESLQSSYGDYLDATAAVYSGFSQGAIMGVHILQQHATRFPRAVLIEGGFKKWNQYTSSQYAKGGGRRVLFACGQWNCDNGGKQAAKSLEKAGIATKVVSALGSGHTYGGAVADQLAAAFDWVVEGDARWQQPSQKAPVVD